MKLTMLKMSKKKIIGAVCAIALFAGGAVVGAQIYANAANNAIAVLPIAKGGTNANTPSTAATNILGTNFGNYSGTLPVTKGGTGVTALSTSISSSSTDSQVPTAKSVYSLGKNVALSGYVVDRKVYVRTPANLSLPAGTYISFQSFARNGASQDTDITPVSVRSGDSISQTTGRHSDDLAFFGGRLYLGSAISANSDTYIVDPGFTCRSGITNTITLVATLP